MSSSNSLAEILSSKNVFFECSGMFITGRFLTSGGSYFYRILAYPNSSEFSVNIFSASEEVALSFYAIFEVGQLNQKSQLEKKRERNWSFTGSF